MPMREERGKNSLYRFVIKTKKIVCGEKCCVIIYRIFYYFFLTLDQLKCKSLKCFFYLMCISVCAEPRYVIAAIPACNKTEITYLNGGF